VTPAAVPSPGEALDRLVRVPDAVTLFEFSAATWITHRIHYDVEYARSEGHPSLLVHGPLQGCFLATAAEQWATRTGGVLRRLTYRHERGCVVGTALVCEGTVAAVTAVPGVTVVPAAAGVPVSAAVPARTAVTTAADGHGEPSPGGRLARCDIWVREVETNLVTTRGTCEVYYPG
jgi:3-methylfumaryl-CoA hydratase